MGPVGAALGQLGGDLQGGGALRGARSASDGQVLQRGVGDVQHMADVSVRLALAVKHGGALPFVGGGVIPQHAGGDGVRLPLDGLPLGGGGVLGHSELHLGEHNATPLGLAPGGLQSLVAALHAAGVVELVEQGGQVHHIAGDLRGVHTLGSGLHFAGQRRDILLVVLPALPT